VPRVAAIAAERGHVEARLADAMRQERRAADSLTRVRRDYMSGGLPLADWSTMRPKLEEELAGARAARAQIERHLAALSDDQVDDALAATVNQLTAAIAAQRHDAGNVDHVRMLLRRMSAHFTLRAAGDELVLVLVPELRPDALE